MTSINSNKYLVITFILLVLFSSCNNRKKVSTKNEQPDINNNSSISTSTNHNLTNQNSSLSESPLSYLLKYNGKYENEEELLKKEPLSSRLKNAMSSKYQFFLNCCLVESPIKVENGIVYIEGCQAHNCPGVAYRVYIDVGANKIFIGLYNEGETTFFSEGDTNYPKWLTDWWIINNRQNITYVNNKSSSYQNNATENNDKEEETVVRETLDGKYVYKNFEINSLSDPNVTHVSDNNAGAKVYLISFGKLESLKNIEMNIDINFDYIANGAYYNIGIQFLAGSAINLTQLVAFNRDRKFECFGNREGTFSLGNYFIRIVLEPVATKEGKATIFVNNEMVSSKLLDLDEYSKYPDWGLIIQKVQNTPIIKSFYLKTMKEVFIKNEEGKLHLDK